MNRRPQRWDPRGDVSSLEAAVNSLLEDGLSWGRGGPEDHATLQVDVLETGSRYEIIASVPGLQPEDVNVTVLAESVRITTNGTARQSEEGEDPDRHWLIRERYVGRKDRTITLPSPVNADEVTARFEDGVLRVVLPKAETARARRIEITSGVGNRAQEAPIEIEEASSPDQS